MLEFDFMRRALIAAFLQSIMIALIGVIMVNRKTSMVGDALSHTSLAGVGLGLIFGFDPIIGAICVCIIAAFSIEAIRKKFPQQGDMATSIIMSTGLGLAAILSDFTPGSNSLESYLFGNVTSISTADLQHTVWLFFPVVLLSIIYYGALLDIAIDPNLARLSGIKVSFVNGLMTFLTAVTVALASKVVGALLVTSLIVLPVATALLISRSYKMTLWISIFLSILYMMTGICLSYYFDVKPGGMVVLNAVIGMFLIRFFQSFRKTWKNRKSSQKVNK